MSQAFNNINKLYYRYYTASIPTLDAIPVPTTVTATPAREYMKEKWSRKIFTLC